MNVTRDAFVCEDVVKLRLEWKRHVSAGLEETRVLVVKGSVRGCQLPAG